MRDCMHVAWGVDRVPLALRSQSKINDTKDLMKKKVMEIEKSKLDQKGKAAMGFGMPSGVSSGFGSKPGMSGVSSQPDSDYKPSYRADPTPAAAKPSAPKGPSKGMVLGKAKKGTDILESLAKEGETVELDTSSSRPAAHAATIAASASSEPVTLVVEEKLSVLLNKQGGCENLEVQGTMSLVVNHDDGAFICIAVVSGANKNFQFKTHPNIDKAAYASSNTLQLKDPARPFPLGSELGILKWRMQTKDESLVPITINCWPSVSGGQTYVNIEYESTSDFDLQNVSIVIPLPHSGHAPNVNQVGLRVRG